jgi:hypothetical protein
VRCWGPLEGLLPLLFTLQAVCFEVPGSRIWQSKALPLHPCFCSFCENVEDSNSLALELLTGWFILWPEALNGKDHFLRATVYFRTSWQVGGAGQSCLLLRKMLPLFRQSSVSSRHVSKTLKLGRWHVKSWELCITTGPRVSAHLWALETGFFLL